MLTKNDKSQIVHIYLRKTEIEFLILQCDASITACKKAIKNWEKDEHVQGLIHMREKFNKSLIGL